MWKRKAVARTALVAAVLVASGPPRLGATALVLLAQSGSALDDGRSAPRRLAGGLLGPLEPGTAGVAGIVLVTALSLAVTALRRRRSRRLLAARIGARLAGLPASPAAGPPA